MDIWAEIWPNPYPEGKVHKSVVAVMLGVVDISDTMEEIYTNVLALGVADEVDALVTSRAIWTFRNNLRMADIPDEKAVSA